MKKNRLIQKFLYLLFCLLVLPGLTMQAQKQEQRFDLKMQNVELSQIIQKLRDISKQTFAFQLDDVKPYTKVSCDLKQKTVPEILDECLKRTDLSWRRVDETIIIFKRLPSSDVHSLTIKGFLTDKKNEPIPGVTVKLVGASVGTASDINGWFVLKLPVLQGKLEFSFVGYKTETVDFTEAVAKDTLQIVMEEEIESLDEVVVTGVFTKAKESYTGAATTITAADLKRVGNRNILSSIRNIDPSFNIVADPTIGSDPNKLPNITVRGNSSMTTNVQDLQSESQNTQSANLPLFIMDGFEITLERMMDLDDNQVESITLLKDASATAMYGTRGANGVVVITTKQPEPGKLKLTYKGSMNIEAPDLTSYNLLNAKDKLKYEKLAGLYDQASTGSSKYQDMEELYNSRRLAAERGVDTYWLKYPVRTGIGQQHSIRLEGGRDEIRYAIGVSYKNVAGAMKGSDRNTFNGNVFLSYKLKNLTFQNDIQVSHNKSMDSPYGTFSDYARINSYWRPYDDEGNLLKVLDERIYSSISNYTTMKIYNPLYNAYLPSVDESKYTQVQDNFAVEWKVMKGLTVRGSFSVTQKTIRSDDYKPASHTDFADYEDEDYDRRGKYTMGTGESLNYETSFTLNYNKLFHDVHQLYVGLNYNFAQEKSENYTFVAEGIPDDNSDFMGLASMYQKDSAPTGTEGLSRRAGGILNVNYTYDRRYFLDISGKMEGSSKFGSDNRMAPFWSVGSGWNIHQESFLRDHSVVNVARLRVSYGTSGTQNFSPYQAMRTFKYLNKVNYNGKPGAYLMGIGNPELGWQKTGQLNIGMDLELFDNRLKVTVDWYNKLTDDMLADITLPLSSGFGNYKANIGKVLNRGVEVSLNAYLIRNSERNIYWSVGGTLAHNKNEIREISNSLEFLNQELLEGGEGDAGEADLNPSFLFKEGQSMNTIFVVKSQGIDPANGKEIFVRRNGTLSYNWYASDKVACGVNEPKIWGNLNTLLRFKNWTFNAIFGYRYGGQMYNSTLANKVENVKPIYNADKRVLKDRWQKADDHAKYKGVADQTTTKATSRFVADENTLECRSVSLGYEWESDWLQKHFSISYLALTAYGEDLFYITSIKQERGTSYPFSRKFSLSLSVRF